MEKFEAVYIGARLNSRGLVYCWQPIEKGALIGPEVCLLKGKKKSILAGEAKIGGIYLLREDSEKMVGLVDRSMITSFSDEAKIRSWVLEDKAAKAAVSLEKTLESNSKIEKMTIEEVALLYSRSRTKLSILSTVINLITNLR